MNLLFFIETGLGNGRAMADEAIAIHDHGGLTIFTVSSGYDQEPGVTESVINKGISNLCLKHLDEHKDFMRHSKILHMFIEEKDINIVHVQSNWALLLVRYAMVGIKKKPKIIYTIHAFRNNKSFLKRNTARLMISAMLILLADKVITCSRFMYDSFKIINYKSVILPLGVDNRFIDRSYKEVSGPMRIIFPGMFREGKGQDMLIRAFALYRQETDDKDSVVYLPGDGELLNPYKKLVNNYGLQNQIIFPGKLPKDKILELFDQCNILACTSKSETFSQILAEGYCLGKCIVTRPVGIANDIVVNCENGFIIQNDTQLKDVLCQLSLDKSKYAKMGEFNYNHRFYFSWDKITKEYLDICKSLFS